MNNDDSIKFQAFSYLSRAHLSISTSFYSASFASIAYFGFFFTVIYPKTNGYFLFILSLILFPALIPSYLFLKYYVSNVAFKKSAEDIEFSDGKSLYSYLWGYPDSLHGDFFLGKLFLRLNQPILKGKKNPLFYTTLSVLLFLFIIFVAAFYYVMK